MHIVHLIFARICQEEIECTKAKGQLISEWIFGDFKSPKDNQILPRFLPYEAREEILVEIGWLFGRFEDNKISFWD